MSGIHGPALKQIDITLPSGLATALNQTDGSQKTQIVDAGGEAVTITDGKLDVNAAINTAGLATATLQEDIKLELQKINSLVPAVYDYISLAYTGANLTTVIFKTGGSAGTTVSTLTLGYTGDDLTSVTKT